MNFIEFTHFFPFQYHRDTKLMVFIDGENFAIRYKDIIKESTPPKHVQIIPDIFLWSSLLNSVCHKYRVIRKYYYTSVYGDSNKIEDIEDKIKQCNIDCPRVFKKKKNGRTKRVDIALATDMLYHATKRNYDVALLIAGDEDYVPLVQAVQAEGCRVYVWFFSSGISRGLKITADKFINITEFMTTDEYVITN